MGFVTGLLSGSLARGFNADELLAGVGLCSELLQRTDIRISPRNYANMYNQLALALDDEAFGMFSAPLRSGTFEFLTRSVVSSADLHEALQRISRFLRLGLPEMQLTVTRTKFAASIEIREAAPVWQHCADPRRIFAFEWLLRLIHALMCWLVDRNISLDSVLFPYPRPPHACEYAVLYTAHSTFDAASLIASFEPGWLDAPVRREEKDLVAFLDGAPGRISVLYRRDHEVVRQVREIVAAALPETVALADIASKLNLSTRTLQRRLTLEGASLRAIKDTVRRSRAFAKLERSDEPIEKIASDLGYSDTTAFYRAFHNWTQEGPKKYRQISARR